EDAERYMLGAVQRNLEHPEDWTDERVAREFSALVRVDTAAHGPLLVPQAPVISGDAPDWSLEDWSLDRFQGAAPARKWLVEGLIPAGTAGVFAAVGDAGKSMMALWLAYVVGCYPKPEGIAPEQNAPRFFGQPVLRRGAAV